MNGAFRCERRDAALQPAFPRSGAVGRFPSFFSPFLSNLIWRHISIFTASNVARTLRNAWQILSIYDQVLIQLVTANEMRVPCRFYSLGQMYPEGWILVELFPFAAKKSCVPLRRVLLADATLRLDSGGMDGGDGGTVGGG